ncbi:concanavalin A-like lectin/glucanase domain-containing protein, partial [Blastocladiella britannica]
SVVTNLPVPWLPAELDTKPPPGVLYYEVTIEHLAPRTVLALGLATTPYPQFRLPGWHDWSVGLHSDDGRVYVSNDGDGDSYTSAFRQDDVIGVGIDTVARRVFYTRNGHRMRNVEAISGAAPAETPIPLLTVHPIIGADGPCVVRANFGTAPFRWAAANEMRAAYA